jgi:glycosyltransferase involved in cell wall biosynthesis
LIGKAIVKEFPDIKCEVLQVDYKADRIYEAELEKGLIHKNFPAITKESLFGLKKRKYYYSKLLIDYIKIVDKESNIVFLPNSVMTPFIYEIMDCIHFAHVVHFDFLNIRLSLPVKIWHKNPLKVAHRFLLNKKLDLHYNKIKSVFFADYDPDIIAILQKRYPHLKIYEFILGTELNYWKKEMTKIEARKLLRLPAEAFIIILSQRLVPEYQIDKLISIVPKIKTNNEFLFLITGHGEKTYELFLKKMIKKHGVEHRIKLLGYLPEEKLKLYYTASDVFATVPRLFGGSYSSVKAMAMELPIIHVELGLTYRFLKQNNAGCYLNPINYNQWIKVFSEVIDGKMIKTVPREVVLDYFSWKKSAIKLVNNLKELIN